MTHEDVIHWLLTKPLKFQQIEKECGLSSGRLTHIVQRIEAGKIMKRSDGKATIAKIGKYFEETFKINSK